MKSGRQRREALRQKRLERAKRLEERLRATPHGVAWPGAGVEEADRALLARHNNTYGTLPAFYVDKAFTCRDCGQEQVWTAKQQKWWYEERLGPIDSTAIRCLPCRRARRTQQAHPGANLLGERRDRLRALGEGKPDTDARADVEAALADKWWGLRTTAIATLGAWGDDVSVERLKALLAEHAARDGWNSWNRQARAAAFKALAPACPMPKRTGRWPNTSAAPRPRPCATASRDSRRRSGSRSSTPNGGAASPAGWSVWLGCCRG